MSFSIDRIPDSLRIDPDAAGQENRRRQGRETRKRGGGDSVSISEEARRRSNEGHEAEPEEAEPR